MNVANGILVAWLTYAYKESLTTTSQWESMQFISVVMVIQ